MANERTLESLTPRQRQVWEMSNALGEFDRKMNAGEISKVLGITTNSVYVTRRRVKKLLGLDDGEMIQPRRIIRQESGLEVAKRQLEEQVVAYNEEEQNLRERLEQIERERPEIKAALERLEAVTKPVEREAVAA